MVHKDRMQSTSHGKVDYIREVVINQISFFGRSSQYVSR